MTWLASLLVKGAEDFTNTELKFNNKAFCVCSKLKKKKKEISIIMDLTLPEEKLRHKEVTQLASEPAHLIVSYRDPQGQGDRANTGPQGSQPP